MECLVESPDGRVQYMSAKEANALRAKEDLRLKKSQTRKRNHEKITNVAANCNVNDSVCQESQATKKEYELPNRGILSFVSKLFPHTFR